MSFKELFELIVRVLVPKMRNHQGLAIFAKTRSKFEGWVKVELIDSLSPRYPDVAPERHRIDITFDNWALELKTVNTNIRFPNVENRTRPIAVNTQSVIDDINRLKHSGVANRAVIFLTFPVRHDNRNWQIQLRRISRHLTDLKHCEFSFPGDVPAVIYCGKVPTDAQRHTKGKMTTRKA